MHHWDFYNTWAHLFEKNVLVSEKVLLSGFLLSLFRSMVMSYTNRQLATGAIFLCHGWRLAHLPTLAFTVEHSQSYIKHSHFAAYQADHCI